MPLDMEVNLGLGDVVLDGDPAPPPKRGTAPPVFGRCLLWPNGWMDEDATGTEVNLCPGHIVLDGDPAKWHINPTSRLAQPTRVENWGAVPI